MAWTYTTLSQAIQDYLETDEESFVAHIPDFIRQAEERIIQVAQLPELRKSVTAVLTANSQYLATPPDFLAPYSLAINNSGYDYLLLKEVSFIRSAYPDPSYAAPPRYYAIFNNNRFILGPTPDQAYPVELHYMHKPESIVTAGSSWIGTNAENALLFGALLHGAIYQKADGDIMGVLQQKFDQALIDLKEISQGYNTTDSYRRDIPPTARS